MLYRSLQVSGFKVHLKYDVVLILRRGDLLIMEVATNKGVIKEELLSISRSRGSPCEIFIYNKLKAYSQLIVGSRLVLKLQEISDIVTADGKYLEEFTTVKISSREHASKYKFLNEAPTQGNWTTWTQFWRQNTVDNFKLTTLLEEWTHPTQRLWEWYFDQEGSSIQKRTPHGISFYIPAPGYHRTRSRKSYIKS